MYSFLFMTLSSCATNAELVKKRAANEMYVSTAQLYTPKYEPNGGKKRETIFNKSKVLKENQFIAVLNKVKPIDPILKGNSSTAVDLAIDNAIKEYNLKIYDLESRLSQIDLDKRGAEELYTNLLIELNNLICKEREGIMQLEKKVQKLFGDVSFSTASCDISGAGKKSVEDVIDKIIKEFEKWKNYVNTCNEKIFEKDLIVAVIDISGYADQRGDTQYNLDLSRKRANSVEHELRGALIKLVKEKKVTIVFDKIYSEGYGEKLPPGVEKGSQDDPTRRICLINFVVGPARFLGN
jgi:outer membrane protein OmpA-like peptidoglycan-associated protein